MTHTPAFRVCPIREHDGGFEHDCARGKLTIAQGLLEGQLSYSPELIDLIFADPDCGLCTWVCNNLPQLDPPAVWRAMRRDIVSAGLGPPEPLQEKDDRVRERHNTFGAKADRAEWARGLDLAQEGELLYFAGCYAAYTQTEIATATVAILKESGVTLAHLGEQEWCCGVTQFHDGSTAIAEEMARHNVTAIESSGAKSVLTSCAECYKVLKIDYPDLVGELPFEVLHVSEFLAEMVREGSLSLDEGLPEKRVTFHDPCHLGRHGNVYEQPRSVIEAIPGVELVEMQRHRNYAWCCGYGADMVSCMRPELASQIAGDRMEEARKAGAEAVITACPRCVRGLSRANGALTVYDLTVVVAKSLGLST
jgi:heterodisulfide reductase subunit D